MLVFHIEARNRDNTSTKEHGKIPSFTLESLLHCRIFRYSILVHRFLLVNLGFKENGIFGKILR